MKKIISFLVLSILLTSAFAQVKRNKPAKAIVDSAVQSTPVISEEVSKSYRKDKRAMMKELNLSRTQMKQLKGMRQDAKAQKEAIDNNTKLSDEERKQQLREFRVKQMKKMQEILTPEQINKLKEMRKQKAGDKMEMEDLEMEN
jgi:Spy/CpxP family protein refolding chaperone